MTQGTKIFVVAFVLVLVALGLALYGWLKPAPTPPPPAQAIQTWQVTLCYPDLKASRLVRVAVTIAAASEERVAEELLERLKTPESPNLSPALPSGTGVLLVRREGNLLVVDLSKEFTQPQFWQGSDVAHLRLQAIVQTLCSLPNVRAVRFLVNGQTPEALGGHEEVSEPVEPDPSL